MPYVLVGSFEFGCLPSILKPISYYQKQDFTLAVCACRRRSVISFSEWLGTSICQQSHAPGKDLLISVLWFVSMKVASNLSCMDPPRVVCLLMKWLGIMFTRFFKVHLGKERSPSICSEMLTLCRVSIESSETLAGSGLIFLVCLFVQCFAYPQFLIS